MCVPFVSPLGLGRPNRSRSRGQCKRKALYREQTCVVCVQCEGSGGRVMCHGACCARTRSPLAFGCLAGRTEQIRPNGRRQGQSDKAHGIGSHMLTTCRNDRSCPRSRGAMPASRPPLPPRWPPSSPCDAPLAPTSECGLCRFHKSARRRGTPPSRALSSPSSRMRCR